MTNESLLLPIYFGTWALVVLVAVLVGRWMERRR